MEDFFQPQLIGLLPECLLIGLDPAARNAIPRVARGLSFKVIISTVNNDGTVQNTVRPTHAQARHFDADFRAPLAIRTDVAEIAGVAL